MSNESLNDDVLFDRLVDGELKTAERHRLLASLDGQPGGWRNCALAFLEAQSWRKEFHDLAHGITVQNKEDEVRALQNASGKKSPVAATVQWLALAASLLLAFGLGWMHREQAIPLAVNSSPPGNTAPSASGGKASNALTLYVRDESGRMQPVQVPLVDANTLDKQLGMTFQTGLPDDLRHQLNDRGYDIQSKRQYAPLWLENGRPMIVPVEDTRIVPVSGKVL
jgi:anti-sigma factor RsiW